MHADSQYSNHNIAIQILYMQVFGEVRSGSFPTGFGEQMDKVFAVVRALTVTRSEHRPSSFEIRSNLLAKLKLSKKARKAYVPVL